MLPVSSHTYFLWVSPDFTVIFPTVSCGPLLLLPQGIMVLTVLHMFAHIGLPSQVKRIIIRSPISVSRVMRNVKVLLPEISSTLKKMEEELRRVIVSFSFWIPIINKHSLPAWERLCACFCSKCYFSPLHFCSLFHVPSTHVFHSFMQTDECSLCAMNTKLTSSPWSRACYFELLEPRTWNINNILHPRCHHAIFH